LLAEREVNDCRAIRLVESPPQQHVSLRRFRIGFEKIAAIEHDGVDLVARYELDDLDLSAALLGEGTQVVVGENDGAVALLVRLVDVIEIDDSPTDLAASLIADATAVFVMHLVQVDVVILGRAVELDRNVHEAEGYGT